MQLIFNICFEYKATLNKFKNPYIVNQGFNSFCWESANEQFIKGGPSIYI